MEIGRNKKVVRENGKIIFREEKIYDIPDTDGKIKTLVSGGEITQEQVMDYQTKLMIYNLHQELHQIYKTVKSCKDRAQEIKSMLREFGIDTTNLLKKPIPDKPEVI